MPAAECARRLALRYRITSLASLGFVLVSSPTLRVGIDVFLRFNDLNASMTRLYREGEGRDLRLVFTGRDMPADLRGFVVERSLAAGIAVTSQILGRAVVPRRVELAFPRPPVIERYRRMLGVVPAFNAARSALTFRRGDMDASLAQANPVALRMAEDYSARLLTTQRARSGMAGIVRDRIARSPWAIPEMGVLASELYMSPRTLRRRLEREGATYQQLCLEVRHLMAEQLLAVPDLTVKQIAARTGYSEAAAFTRAFAKWKGMSPTEYRDAHMHRGSGGAAFD